MEYHIVPAILRTTEEDYLKDLTQAQTFAQAIQIDYVDGLYAPQKTVSIKTILDHQPKLPVEIDLMVAHPVDEITYFLETSWIETIIVHAETIHSPSEAKMISDTIRSHKKQAGIAMNPGSDLAQWDFAQMADLVMVMGIEPGAQGRPFEPTALQTIEAVRGKYPYMTIEVDGHVTSETLPLLIKAGANRFASGSFIFKQANPKMQYEKLVALLPQPEN